MSERGCDFDFLRWILYIVIPLIYTCITSIYDVYTMMTWID